MGRIRAHRQDPADLSFSDFPTTAAPDIEGASTCATLILRDGGASGRRVTATLRMGFGFKRQPAVHLQRQPMGDLNRAYKITRDDAERICEKEARARFSPGNGLIGASLSDHSKSTYTVEWGEPSMAGTVRKGRCEIDSYSGHIRKFKASVGW